MYVYWFAPILPILNSFNLRLLDKYTDTPTNYPVRDLMRNYYNTPQQSSWNSIYIKLETNARIVNAILSNVKIQEFKHERTI